MIRPLWRENRSWLEPDHVNADFTSYVGALQTWVLRSEGKTILVDTGAGNGKDRPLAAFAYLHTRFLEDTATMRSAMLSPTRSRQPRHRRSLTARIQMR